MSDTRNKRSADSVGFGGLLAILFVGLKLGDVIAWSWWWVLCPLWIPFAIVGVMFAVAGILYMLSLMWKQNR